MSNLEKLIEPEQLEAILGNPDILIADLCNPDMYQRRHIPGAHHVSPAELVAGTPPATGKLAPREKLEALFSRLGLTPGKHVVAYDDEGGGWAGRFIWTLDIIGHKRWSYLNGGMVAWAREGFPADAAVPGASSEPISLNLDSGPVIEAEEIMANLDRLLIWDARSYPEYTGERVVARRGGHIPGAVHCEWTSLMDPERNLRLRSDAREYLTQQGITPDKAIATHCQTHHRSGFTYLVARLLDFPDIRAYHGSWAEWGNRADTPIEVGP